MRFQGDSKSLEYRFFAAGETLLKHSRPTLQAPSCTIKQLARDILVSLSVAARKDRIPREQVDHFNAMSRAEILCEVAQRVQDSLIANNKRYGAKKPGLFEHDSERQLTLRRNVERLTREQLCEGYGIEDYMRKDNRKIDFTDVQYAQFLRENGMPDRKGAEITVEEDPMDELTILAMLGFFDKPKSIEQATDDAARRILERDMVNPRIIDQIIRDCFGSLYRSTPDAHERVIKRTREIFREERDNGPKDHSE